MIYRLFRQNQLSSTDSHSFLFKNDKPSVIEASDAVDTSRADSKTKAEELAVDPDAYFAKHEEKINNIISKLGTGDEEFSQRALRRIQSIKEDYYEALNSVKQNDSLERYVVNDVNYFIKRLQQKKQASERMKNNPELKKLYEKLDNMHLGSPDKLLLLIDDAFENSESPELAIHSVMVDFIKERFLGHTDKPANPDKLVGDNNRLSKKQRSEIFEKMGVDFNSLDISSEQIAKMDVISQITYDYEGMTYVEMGMLDTDGNVLEDGVNRLLEYKNIDDRANRIDENMEDWQAQNMRNNFGSMIPIMDAMKEYGGIDNNEGGLPTITYAGRSFDLNEIAVEHKDEMDKFTKLYENSAPLEDMDDNEKANELPQSLKDLFEYRFDENTGALRSLVRNELPKSISTRLKALGMEGIEVISEDDGKIRQLRFSYQGKEMELSIGKRGWGEDKQPHLRGIYKGKVLTSKPINLLNISSELSDMSEYIGDNEKNVDKINEDLFPDVESEEISSRYNYHSNLLNSTIFELKERYLGTVKKPKATNQKGIDGKELEHIEKILPMLVDNKDLGITDDMSVIEALLKIYNAPNSEDLLSKDYSSSLDDLSNSDSEHYSGVEPSYMYSNNENDREESIKTSRTSTNPEYIDRKEQLAEMKNGDKLKVGDYTFTLVDSFQNHEYRFTLDGYDIEPFELNVVDLVNRSPEDQLKHMMENSFIKRDMEMDEFSQGLRDYEELGKEMILKREFKKGELPVSRMKELGLNYDQIEVLKLINSDDRINIRFTKDRYGEIDNFKIKWRNEEEKTNYSLDSSTGNYWRMTSMEDGSSKKGYLSYDTRTEDLFYKIK